MNARQPLELPSHEFMAQLARDDPSGYEELRQRLIDSLIDSAPDRMRDRLRGLQFRVDGMRRLSRSSLGATIRIYRLMWESFYRLNDEISSFGSAAGTSGQSARVIEFRRRDR